MKPTLRKPFGVIGLIVGLIVYVALAASLVDSVGSLHWLLQLVVYAVLGIAWVFPLRPLLLWMETGRWRA